MSSGCRCSGLYACSRSLAWRCVTLSGQAQPVRKPAPRPTIKDLPAAERPRERLLAQGPEALSNTELLAILLRTGRRGVTALQLAHELLSHGEKADGDELQHLLHSPVAELAARCGIGLAKAAQLKAAVELGARVQRTRPERVRIRQPDDAAQLVMESMRQLDREHFKIILLDTKNQVLGVEAISIGSLNSSIVHPREIFKAPIRRSANAIILVHNHPSGDPTPSPEDREVTRRLVEAGRLLGIEVLDHIIIGDRRFVSLRERAADW